VVAATHDERFVASFADRVVRLPQVVPEAGMIATIEVTDRQLESPLGRANALTKLAIALAWLIGLATTVSPWPPLFLAAVAALAG
jgi:hypothetical protein